MTSAQHQQGNDELQRALGQALARQAATSEILRVIGSAPNDVAPAD